MSSEHQDHLVYSLRPPLDLRYVTVQLSQKKLRVILVGEHGVTVEIGNKNAVGTPLDTLVEVSLIQSKLGRV